MRQRAETRLEDARSPEETGALTPEVAGRLVHELRVHQIELEMQNEDLRRAQEALEESRARYFDLYDLAPVGYVTLAEGWLIREANLAAANLLDTPRASLAGQPLSRFIVPEDQGIHYRCRGQLSASGVQQSCEVRLCRTTGAPAWVQMEIGPGPQERHGRSSWRAVLTDISALKRGERELLDNQARLRLVADIADLTFWEWNPRTHAVFFPPAWQRQTGYAADEAPTTIDAWSTLLHPDDRERILSHLDRFGAAHKAPSEIQYRLRRKDGAYRWFAARLESILDACDLLDRVLLVQQDVTQRKESEDRAIHLAQHDPLTGLPSRALLDQLADHMLASTRRSGERLAVLFFDLDGFKAVNDAYGHAVGDRILREMAHRLRDAFREEDLVARLGGDEFIVVLADIGDSEDAARAARTAIDALTPAYRIEGLELSCVPSLGISLYPGDGDSIDRLIHQADLAMYHAKEVNPGGYWFAGEL